MNTLEAMAKRRSVRSYKPEQIPDEVLGAILKAGASAPVARGDYDSLHITVIQNRELLDTIGNAVSEMLTKRMNKPVDKNFGAPTMILVSSRPGVIPGLEYANVACVLDNMIIAATDLGIDNILWGGAAVVVEQNEALRARLAIPEGFAPVLCASFGYAAAEEDPKPHTISVNKVL
ncbi:MAG: nitroreductase family protein [Oscillospiraceae bacterium]|nr:nitroreductase family protein [Oscillospiraceae bacterium]